VFPRLQVRVTYRHAGWDGPVPPSAADKLPSTLRRLQSSTLRIALFGDSISAGCNATAQIEIPPHRPPFGDQLAQALRAAFHAKVEFFNEAVGGMSAKWGVENIASVARHSPDLVIFGWGMNDASSRQPPETFKSRIEQQMQAVRTAAPDAEFILIATMTANPQWNGHGGDLYESYLRELRTLVGPGVALADMTTLWNWVLTRKRFVDLTGNGVNHPNDFGHTLYTQLLLATMGVAP